MSAGIPIRAATLNDQKSLIEMQRKYPQIVTWNESVWSGMLSGEGIPLRRVWLAEAAASLVGFVVLSLAGEVCEFEMVLVDEAARGKGIGRTLCTTAMQWASAQGVRQIELEVRGSNAAARALYVSLGFVEQGVRRNYYRHPTEDAVLMGAML